MDPYEQHEQRASYAHILTVLPNGLVLAAGGDNGKPVASAELYSVTTGQWNLKASMNVARWYHAATLLPNGVVLVAGGSLSLRHPRPSCTTSVIQNLHPRHQPFLMFPILF